MSKLQESLEKYGNYLKSTTRMTDIELEHHRDLVLNMDFDPTTLIDTVFNKVSHFVTLCSKAQKPITQAQTICLAVLIIKKTNVFSRYIEQWNDLPANQST